MLEFDCVALIDALISSCDSNLNMVSKKFVEKFINDAEGICDRLEKKYPKDTKLTFSSFLGTFPLSTKEDKEFIKKVETEDKTTFPLVGELLSIYKELERIKMEVEATKDEEKSLKEEINKYNSSKLDILKCVSEIREQIRLLQREKKDNNILQKIIDLFKVLLLNIVNMNRKLDSINSIVDKINKRREKRLKEISNGVLKFKSVKACYLNQTSLNNFSKKLLNDLNNKEKLTVSNREQTILYQDYMIRKLQKLNVDIDEFAIINILDEKSGLDYLVGFNTLKARLVGELITIVDFLHKKNDNNSCLFDFVEYILTNIGNGKFIAVSHNLCVKTINGFKLHQKQKENLFEVFAIPVDQSFRTELFRTYIEGQYMLDCCGTNEISHNLALRKISDGSGRIDGKLRIKILEYHLGKMEEREKKLQDDGGYCTFLDYEYNGKKKENYDEFDLFEYLYMRYLNVKSNFYEQCGLRNLNESGLYWENEYIYPPYGRYHCLELQKEKEKEIIKILTDIVNKILKMQLEYLKFHNLIVKNSIKESYGKEKK